MSSKSRQSRAAKLHRIAEELGVDSELVAACGKGIADEDAIRDAVKAYVARQTPRDEKPRVEETPSNDDAPRQRKASLTLSQRRALVKLQASPQTPATAFKALPYDYLVECGLARRLDDGSFTLTLAGVDRAAEINPAYVVWSAGESVCGDKSRPIAGTHRAAKGSGIEIPA